MGEGNPATEGKASGDGGEGFPRRGKASRGIAAQWGLGRAMGRTGRGGGLNGGLFGTGRWALVEGGTAEGSAVGTSVGVGVGSTLGSGGTVAVGTSIGAGRVLSLSSEEDRPCNAITMPTAPTTINTTMLMARKGGPPARRRARTGGGANGFGGAPGA
jgi:hypothetical protein